MLTKYFLFFALLSLTSCAPKPVKENKTIIEQCGFMCDNSAVKYFKSAKLKCVCENLQ